MKPQKFLATLCLSLAALTAGQPAIADTVGLHSSDLTPVYSTQHQSEWCWAACIQMISNLYGADLTQDEVVARTYGPGVNRPGTFETITANLNCEGTTHSGRKYTITSHELENAQLPEALVKELAAGHPVMLGYNTEGGGGHAVVCTAVSFSGPASHPTVTSLTVRDPWPSAENRAENGRRVYSGADLGPRIMKGWIIRLTVHDADGQLLPAPQGYTINDGNNNNFPPAPQPVVRRNDDDEELANDADKVFTALLDLVPSRIRMHN